VYFGKTETLIDLITFIGRLMHFLAYQGGQKM